MHGRRTLLFFWLAFAFVTFDAFAILAWAVPRDNALTRLDHRLVQQLHAAATPGLRRCFEFFTEAGHPGWMFWTPVGIGALLLCLRSYRLAAVAFIAGRGGSVLEEYLKDLFHRARPKYAGAKSYSFPSGHSMGSALCYGLLAYLLLPLLPRRWQRWAVGGFLALLVLAIGFSRMYLGKHYLTDVLGGFAAGLCWLAVSVLLVEGVSRALAAFSRPPTAESPPEPPRPL